MARARFLRSAIAALVISYPLAYFIAFRGGRWKNLLLLLVIAPFFVTYLIRTLAWQTILTDDGLVADVLRSVGLLSDDGRLLATSTAVVAGITYNFLPFMALPLYVSLEQIDSRLVEAATDLYASRVQAFLRVTLPLSLPGVFAGTLLTFIPAMGDFVNAELLGTPRQAMIGIRTRGELEAVADKIAELDEVDYVVVTAGSYDLLVEVVCESDEALLHVLTHKIRAIEDVISTETFMYLKLRKQQYDWGTR